MVARLNYPNQFRARITEIVTSLALLRQKRMHGAGIFYSGIRKFFVPHVEKCGFYVYGSQAVCGLPVDMQDKGQNKAACRSLELAGRR